MNWGGFAGGFAQGLNQTFDSKGIARYLMSPERRQEEIMAQGMAEAKAAREAEIGNMIQGNPIQQTGITGTPAGEGVSKPTTTPDPTATPQAEAAPTTTPVSDAPAPTATPGSGAKAIVASEPTPITPQATETPVAKPATTEAPTATPDAKPVAAQGLPYTVGGKGYATMDEAKAAAEKQVPSVMDFMYKNAFPKMQQAYIAAGNIEAADKLQKYIESKRGQDAINTYGKAMNKLMFTNDVDGAVKELGTYYNKFVDDGVDFVKGEVTKDGQIAITTKRREDGKEDVVNMSRGQVLRMGMAYNPAKLLEMNLSEAAEAEKAQAKTRSDIAKEDRAFNRDIEKMTIEKQLDAANASTKTRREVNGKIDALRSAGYSEDFINGALPGLLGIGDFKKATSPEEARRLAFSDRMKNDPMFGRKTQEEQSAILDKDMAIIYSGGKPTNTPSSAAPATPAANGLPKTSGKGIPVFDTKTGTIVYK